MSADLRRVVSAPTRRWLDAVSDVTALVGAPRNDSWDERRRVATSIADTLATAFARPAPAGVERFAIELPLSGGLSAQVFRPTKAAGALPTQLYLHGGGFLFGSENELWNSRILSERARYSGVQIISLGYRLAPEHPYPAAQLDVLAALRHLVENAEEYQLDPSRLGVGGNSAGGSIVAGAMLRLRDENRRTRYESALRRADLQLAEAAPLQTRSGDPFSGEVWQGSGELVVVHQLLEVTPADFDLEAPPVAQLLELTGEDGVAELVRAYTDGGRAADQYLEPGRAADVSGLPPALIMVAEFDPMRFSAESYAERLAAAGVGAQVHVGAGMVHGSVSTTAVDPAARLWQQVVVDSMAEVYRSGVQNSRIPE